jgi:hypothetical protein
MMLYTERSGAEYDTKGKNSKSMKSQYLTLAMLRNLKIVLSISACSTLDRRLTILRSFLILTFKALAAEPHYMMGPNPTEPVF